MGPYKFWNTCKLTTVTLSKEGQNCFFFKYLKEKYDQLDGAIAGRKLKRHWA